MKQNNILHSNFYRINTNAFNNVMECGLCFVLL